MKYQLVPLVFLLSIVPLNCSPLPKNLPHNATEHKGAMESILRINRELDYFEGDIIWPMTQDNNRNAIKDENLKWSPVIPYVVHGQYSFETRQLIHDVLAEYSVRMCVTFKRRENENSYLLYTRGSGCYSSVGEVGGKQEVSIGYGCESNGIIKHETMHALGFWHEQSRYDRDEFVQIVWENIQEGKEHNFNKYTEDQITTLDEPYDYGSVMHYASTAFSANGEPTIIALQPGGETMGQRYDLSDIDLRKLRKLYGCELDVQGWSNWTSWSDCDVNCQRHRMRFCEGIGCAQPSETELIECDESCTVGLDKDCPPRVTRELYGVVMSPLYPYNYKEDVQCLQTIEAVSGENVVLSFESIDVEDYEGICYYDWIKIYDGADINTPLIGTFCGTSVPQDIRSSGNSLTILLASDYSVTRRGFFANFYTTSPSSALHACHFEGDISNCGWSNDDTADFDWFRGKGSTPSGYTGPSYDHTTGQNEGYYLFIETSSPVTEGMKARVLSPVLPPATDLHCLEFSYHMYGDNVESMTVYQVLQSGETLPLSTFYGNRGDQWLDTKITLHSYEPYQILFEARRGDGYMGDIAFDDVIVLPGWCDYDGSGYALDVVEDPQQAFMTNSRSDEEASNLDDIGLGAQLPEPMKP